MLGDGAYCTIADVAQRLKNITIRNDTDNTIVIDAPPLFAYGKYLDAVLSSSQVAKYIAEKEADVEDLISQKYTVPVVKATSPKAWARISEIVRGFVIGECYPILKLSGRAMESEDEKKNVMSAYGVAKAKLTAIMADEKPLTDVHRTVPLEESTSASDSGEGNTIFQKFDPRTDPPRW